MPQVAVIILNWNGRKLMEEFLPTVVEHTSAIGRVIVADNGSTDDSVEWLKTHFPQVELLQFSENHGFAGGYNRALAHYADRYDFAVLLNSDVAVTDDWLTPLFDFISSQPDCSACMPKIRSYRDPDFFEYAGAAGGFIDRNGYPYCRGRVFGSVERDEGQYDDVCQVFWATGAAMMVRIADYLEVGGLDEQFFAHMEEIDLCWRMQLIGKNLYVVPQSIVYHLGGGSLDASNPRKTYLNFRNNLLMLYKNLPDATRRSTLFRRRLLDTLAWGMYVAKFDWKNAGAILRAHKDFKKMRRQYDSFPNADILNTNPSRPNIIMDYYVRGRKKFTR
ncbi:MAG: glycosyltransferase family 2 protein [Bacteroides sp.]|nr:glycosyltransferase family 2 protein [Bacteroides sp.]MCM1413091.1 glycosyltransferase family 2 protein [Bacteroides sp.]MCM1472167.1 glycosyltransferase family 2 protein [Bacteroides sp.]